MFPPKRSSDAATVQPAVAMLTWVKVGGSGNL